MSSITHNEPEKILELNDTLQDLEKHPSFKNAQRAAASITSLLGLPSNLGSVLLSKVPGTIANQLEVAEGYADKRAAYKYNTPEGAPFDIKLFWVQKTSKRIISSLVALTPNFEDEPFYLDKNIGIDIITPHSSDRLFLVLSSSYNIRLVELKGALTNTQKEIFTKWVQDFDFNNKPQIHTILWNSLDLKSLNESFYKKIAEFFSELKVHLKTTPLFDERGASHFANRLIGRLIFCWFVRKRGLINEIPRYLEILPEEDSVTYYHNRLEKLFFSVLNTPIDQRIFEDMETPFLNGGLFEPRSDDSVGNSSLTFPKDYFHRFFAFLNQYNFTTDESTSDYQQVAIDPEMLGKIFENLLAEQREDTGEQARKAKGAFYTPREIVDYMCRQSIREYLKNQLVNEDGIDQVITDLMDTKEHAYDKGVREKIAPYKLKLTGALDRIKVIDPACGSGAFPMGMLKLLEQLYERIDVRFEPYKTKLGIIKNNLYGVDIEPMAVEIARLRAWLSIIVDDDINPSLPNRGIEPLPNLDFKFICANSLIGLDLKPKIEQLTFGADAASDDELIGKLKSLRDEWFDPKERDKTQVKKGYNDIQTKLFSNVIKNWNGTASREDKLNLVEWNPFSDKPARFFDQFWMFGIKGGFDIVIGNPPYLKERDNKQFFKEVNESDIGKKYHQGKMDFWYYFLHRAIDLARNGGVISYITSRYWLNSSGAKKLIERVHEKLSFVNFLDIGKLKVFNDVAGYHMVAIYVKDHAIEEFVYKKVINDLSDINSNQNTNNLKIFQLKNSYIFSNSGEIILENTDFGTSNTICLGQIVEISQGIVQNPDKVSLKMARKFNLSQRDGVFVVTKAELNNISISREEKKYVKDFYDELDYGKYYFNKNSDKYLFYLTKNNCKKIDNLSNIKRHLLKFKPIMDRRRETLNGSIKWFQLHWPRDTKFFNQPKLVMPSMFKENSATIVPEETYFGLSTNMMISRDKDYDMKYILAILNSSLAKSWFYKNGKRRGAGVDIGVEKLRLFPIKKLDIRNQKPFIDSVSKIIDITSIPGRFENSAGKKLVGGYEKEIDQMVYNLYGLTEGEIKTIDDMTK